MNHSPFWPLVWKEYRAGRAFWLAMAAMGLVAQAGVAWLAHRPTDRDWWLYGIALMISAGFAVGIGGTLFAVEHEDRTFALLRIFPVRAKELGAAKLLCALAGLVGLLAVLWLAAGALAGWQTLSSRDASQLWGLWGLACLEGFAWGILCSLVFRSPLRATVLALLAVTLSVQTAVTLTTRHNLAEIGSYSEAIPYRLGLLLVVSAIGLWLLPRWAAGQFPRVAQRIPAPRAVAMRRLASYLWHRISPRPGSYRAAWHLVWQSWWEGRKYFFLLIIASPVAVIGLAVIWIGATSFFFPKLPELLPPGLFIVLPTVLLCSLVGILVFRADQLHGPRFLAERGISGHLVWTSRQLAWGGWLLLWAAGLVLLPSLPASFGPSIAKGQLALQPWDLANFLELYNRQQIRAAWLLWDMFFSAYAAGQFASLMVRRGLLALVLAIALSGIMAGWVCLMSSLSIPPWWSALPLAWSMLLATWLRACAWLLGQSSWRGWVAPIAAVVMPVAWLAFAVPSYRVREIPGAEMVGFGADDIAFLSPPSPAGVDRARARFAAFEEWMARGSSDRSLERAAEVQSSVDRSRQILDFYIATASPEAAAQARSTFDLYQRALELYFTAKSQFTDEKGRHTRRLEQQDEVWMKPIVDLVLEASRRPYNLTALPIAQRLTLGSRLVLDWVLMEDARLDQGNGDLDAALNTYLGLLRCDAQRDACRMAPWNDVAWANRDLLSAIAQWATASGQTPEQIRLAIDGLKTWHDALPPAYTLLASQYEINALAITDLPQAVSRNLMAPQSLSQVDWLTSSLPWERDRAIRLLNQLARWQLADMDRAETSFATDTPVTLWQWFKPADGQHMTLDDADRYVWSNGAKRPRETSCPADWLKTTPLAELSPLAHRSLAWLVVCRETNYRATLIILALEAWKLQHGSLPERLGELVGSEIDAIPLDPLQAQPFLYYPQGIAPVPPPGGDQWRTSPPGWRGSDLDLAAGPAVSSHWSQPAYMTGRAFLWSALNQQVYRQSVVLRRGNFGIDNVGYYRDDSDNESANHRKPAFAVDVLAAGHPFFIPQAEEQP